MHTKDFLWSRLNINFQAVVKNNNKQINKYV